MRRPGGLTSGAFSLRLCLLLATAAVAALILFVPMPASTSKAQAQSGNVTKFVYFIERDQSYNPDHYQAIEDQARALQRYWYDQFGGTFRLNNPVVEVVYGDHHTNWYATTVNRNGPRWYRLENVADEVIGKVGSNTARIVNYPASSFNEPRVGANYGGAWMDGEDLRCILDEGSSYPYPDGNDAHCIGHVAHEMGHNYGLQHTGDSDDCMVWGFYDADRLCDFGAANRASVRAQSFNGPWLDALPEPGRMIRAEFTNATCKVAELFMNDLGTMIPERSIAPSETVTIDTPVGQSWRTVTDGMEQNFPIARPEPMNWIVGGDPCAPGDGNCNGEVAIDDALRIVQYAVGNRDGANSCRERSGEQIALDVADHNADSSVDIVDALLVAQCLVGNC